jgi:putative flippase GtrA
VSILDAFSKSPNTARYILSKKAISVKNLLKKHAEKARFGLVGIVNTAIDFGILFVLVALGLPTIASNFVSTSVALVFSFFANKSFTFRHKGKNSTRQVVLFFAITLFGLWVIQPIIIGGATIALGSFTSAKYLVLLVGKVLATVVTLIWNYLLYRKYVFKK